MRTTRWTVLLMTAALTLTAWAAQKDTQKDPRAEAQLQAAITRETVEGDLKGAIEQYKTLAQSNNKSVAARALVRLGGCYEKQGNAEARKTYEQVLSKFGDQKDAVEQARARLATLGGEGSGSGLRLVDKDGNVEGASPDGRFLLVRNADQGFDLRDLRTGQIRSLVKGPRPAFPASFSPDGRQVALLGGDDPYELRLVGVDGSAERLLWKPDGFWRDVPHWFPDGKRIMAELYYPGDEVSRLVAVSATDGAATTLWEGKNLGIGELSPDGKSVALLRGVSRDSIVSELWLLTLADQSENLLLRWESRIGLPLWTPDGTGVLFPSDRRSPGATADLWLLRVSGGKPMGSAELIRKDLGGILRGGPAIELLPLGPITRDGALYFRRGQTGGGLAQLMTTRFDPDTGKVVGTPTYISRMGGEPRSLSFSQDGRWLAYILQSPMGVSRLVVQSVESGEERVVPLDPEPPRLFDRVVMLPDGRSVLVAAFHPKDGKGIYRVDVANGTWTSLKRPGEEGEVQGYPNGISPDGKTVYLTRQSYMEKPTQTLLIARDIETGQEREVSQTLPLTYGLAFDGTQLAVGDRDGNDLVLKIVPTAGGPSREIFRDSRFGGIWDPNWTPDGRYVIFNTSRSSDRATAAGYLMVPTGGGAARDIGIAPSQDGRFPQYFGVLRVNPNGRQLVYIARSEPGGTHTAHYETWVLENFLPATKSEK